MRNTLIVGGVAAVAVVVGAFVLIQNDSRDASGAPAEAPVTSLAAVAVPFTELRHGTQSSVSERVNYLIDTQAEFDRLWKVMGATGEKPPVDFTTHSVIASFSGKKPTGGYAISIAKVEDTDVRMVTVTVAKPGGGCMTAQSITAPYVLVEVPKTSLALAHEDVATTTDCSR